MLEKPLITLIINTTSLDRPVINPRDVTQSYMILMNGGVGGILLSVIVIILFVFLPPQCRRCGDAVATSVTVPAAACPINKRTAENIRNAEWPVEVSGPVHCPD